MEAREDLGDLKRRIQMTNHVLVQKRQGEEEVKNLLQDVEMTEKLIESVRDKNREMIHRNTVKLSEIRNATDEASIESTKMRKKIKSSEDDLKLAMERLGELRSEKVQERRGSAKKSHNTMSTSVENAAQGIAK